MGRKNAFLGILVFAWFVSLCHGASIKPADVLKITVNGHQEFSGLFTVSEDGTTEYPLLVDEPLTDITTPELTRDLTLRLAKYVDNPFVTVVVVDDPEITVTVLGEVEQPGPVKAYRGVTVQEVLFLAAGSTKRADLTQIKILPKGKKDHQATFYDLEEFMGSGRLAKSPDLGDGDRIVVLGKERSSKVKVIGAVNTPGFHELDEQINLFEIIYLCGGPAEKADLTRVRRLSKHNGETIEEVVNIQQYIDKGNMEGIPMVEEGDVIIVYAKWFDWRTLLAILNNTLLFIVTIQTLTGVFN